MRAFFIANRSIQDILSALHKVIGIDDEIEPYDVTLSYVPKVKRIKNSNLKVLTKSESIIWGQEVLNQLSQIGDLINDQFILLAGKSYVNPIKHGITNLMEPLEGCSQGLRPGKLKELISNL